MRLKTKNLKNKRECLKIIKTVCTEVSMGNHTKKFLGKNVLKAKKMKAKKGKPEFAIFEIRKTRKQYKWRDLSAFYFETLNILFG